MKAKEKIDFVNHIYGLIIEANVHRTDDEVLSTIDVNESYFIDSLSLVRRLNTKAKAQLNKSQFTEVQLLLSEFLKKAGGNMESFLQSLSPNTKNEEILAMFKNYQTLSESDKKAMLMDNKILEVLSKIKNGSDLEIDHE